MKNRTAIFPGSFDPLTLGHVDVIQRALPLFDHLVIAIGVNADKKYMYSLEERKKIIQDTFRGINNIEVVHYEGLTVDFCQKVGAQFILRGLRNPADFEFEKAIAHTNRTLSDIETVFLLTASATSFISSSIVRDVIRNHGDYSKLVPASVMQFTK
ncbi:MAG: pantetheine-phosphate adenylyltransferase [Flavobacteriaceae bacterium]|jgi:pantetheine-phosphate adenylyltransferase|nr:pantetheine-phosphate adenylyltransferase [Flavobacteriaceae bacterium]MDP4675158.1 pantetheine-phosphate adenylyltransferase [Flavobacteriaceae bacterium]MDP4754892.1 pantetheine-phosphate adenylyltransferase [Flavobacteriaceae bacterium]MDP4795024.1 pantetheine-phosphate adenylyltransferase [Flavobacteriaceae bacterium]MDP4884925.1 pantetheine-phosphate adenylyltransferase [Flavobacteriaceae bacterium]